MTTYAKVAAVTGSNKGVGLACVRQLALQYPKSSFNTGPFLIYLTARNEQRGHEALKAISEDKELRDAGVLRSHGGLTDVRYLPLDIDSQESISKFSQSIHSAHPKGIDFLINNAGIAMQGFNPEVVQKTLHCNYYGTLSACQTLLPQIKAGGRLVNVASMSGHLTNSYSSAIQSRFLHAKSVDDITGLMREFEAAVEKGNHKSDWPSAAYAVSKAGVIGFTKCLAEEETRSGGGRLINVCCPGWVKTDMTKGSGHKTVDEGAKTPVMLALGEIGGANGEFWQHERAIKW